jgi:GNAT superfamily N-acetyltransferase
VTLVRRVTPGDAAALRRLRLEALHSDPTAFGSSYAQEAAWPMDRWRAWAAASAAGDDQSLYVAETPGGDLVGLAAAYRQESHPRSLRLVSMWVAPGQRGTGLGRRLTRAVVDWAENVDADELTLWVVETNRVAAQLYRSAGFVPTDVAQPLPSHPELQQHLLRLELPSRTGREGVGPLPAGYVELQPMTSSEFDSFMAWTIADHTAHLMDLFGLKRSDAEAMARASIADELPEGPLPVDHHPCTIRAGVADGIVGWVWFAERTRDGVVEAVIHDVVVFERHRNRGLGASTIDEIETWARTRGIERLVLDVFSDNFDARRFYDRLGFVVAAEGEGFFTLERPVT